MRDLIMEDSCGVVDGRVRRQKWGLGIDRPGIKHSRTTSILLERATQFRCNLLESNTGRVTTIAAVEEANIEDIFDSDSGRSPPTLIKSASE